MFWKVCLYNELNLNIVAFVHQWSNREFVPPVLVVFVLLNL
jgi:hypothetical protein